MRVRESAPHRGSPSHLDHSLTGRGDDSGAEERLERIHNDLLGLPDRVLVRPVREFLQERPVLPDFLRSEAYPVATASGVVVQRIKLTFFKLLVHRVRARQPRRHLNPTFLGTETTKLLGLPFLASPI